MKRLKKLLFAIVLVLIVSGLMLLYMLKRKPGWYADLRALTQAERESAAIRAEDQLLRMRELALAEQVGGATNQVNGAMTGNRVEFTQDELNSVLEKWSKFHGWRSAYERHVSDPTIVLRKGELILAGWVKEYIAVTSLHFRPEVTADQKLAMNFNKVVTGSLPLPQRMYQGYLNDLGRSLSHKLPEWQRNAKFNASGFANESAVATGHAKLLLAALRHEPADAVLFLPLVTQPGGVPVKVTGVDVNEGKLALTIEPMSEPERSAALDRLKE